VETLIQKEFVSKHYSRQLSRQPQPYSTQGLDASLWGLGWIPPKPRGNNSDSKPAPSLAGFKAVLTEFARSIYFSAKVNPKAPQSSPFLIWWHGFGA